MVPDMREICRWIAVGAVALWCLPGCSGSVETSGASLGLDPPAAPGSETPDLHAGAGGQVYLSWVEPTAAGSSLRFASFADGSWAPARTIAEGANWFVNWADFASMAVSAEGTLAAHWRVKSGEETYAYGIRVSTSRDGGDTWSEPVAPHGDDSPTEHGFVTIAPAPGGEFVVAWLDGRDTAGHGHGEEGAGAMTLRAARLLPDGSVTGETLLDDRTCDCCPTDAVMAKEGLVVAYRDRSESEVRDISFCRMDRDTGEWSAPATIHADGWQISGCPVDGPALAATSEIVACAWFTLGGDGDSPQVNVALSRDDGRTFGPPLRIDHGDPIGRCDLEAQADGSFLVSWMESATEEAEIRVRRVTAAGKMDPSRVAATTANDRASGFPRLAFVGPESFLAWTEPGEPSRLHVARLP
jgi:hypothetical protein